MAAGEVPESDVTQHATTPAEALRGSILTASTVMAPPCPPTLKTMIAVEGTLPALLPGQTIEDYQIVRLLGAGGFARVYLARQMSLDRLVALKVSRNQGSEARTLARLEHQHIVQVFAEIVHAEQNLRLLSMQFVPGVTLDRLIGSLGQRPPRTWNGHTLLATLDQLCTETTTLDLGGLSMRAFLETCDHVEVTCWLGARLAEALAHAHGQEIIHRDIKPANILINRYGRPFLADFNIAHNRQSGEGTFGGTLAYMAPEHLEAFLSGKAASQHAVDARSDSYSLALVLFQFLTGQLPFTSNIDRSNQTPCLEGLIGARRAGAPSPRALRPEVPELMDRLLRRCLEPAPERRFPSAGACMHALEGCRALLQADKEAGQNRRLVRACRARPFTMLLVLALVPNLVGSVVNVCYNELLIVNKAPPLQACFHWLILAYNAVTYPLLVLVGLGVLGRTYHGWRRLRDETNVAPEEAARIRRQALALPGWVVGLSCLGWFPGGLVFPAGLSIWAGPVSPEDSMHLLMSFVVSGLIALTYAYFGVQFVVLRVLYPQLWSDPSAARVQMHQELHGLAGQLRRYQFLAVLIPLFGAALLIGTGPDQLSLIFRVLLTSLIVLGLAGFALAATVSNGLTQVLAHLLGGAQEDGKRG